MRQAVRVVILLAVLAAALGAGPVEAQDKDKPRSGGELVFVVASEPPTYDGQAEGTFGVVHPLAPHYNTLLRVDPRGGCVAYPGSTAIVPSSKGWSITDHGRWSATSGSASKGNVATRPRRLYDREHRRRLGSLQSSNAT